MNTENWQKIKDIFSEVVELPENERAAFLNDCGVEFRHDVETLINSNNEAGHFINEPAMIDIGLAAEDQPDAYIGERIDSYKILKEIGHGGMGTVYLASRADASFDKQVAIKLIKRGMDTNAVLKRFVMERQILAQLENPNIAGLLDGGSTPDGLPYLVMEYIEGEPITKFCDSHQFSIEERLELFQEVCSAVSYAHQNLVVHRDLKPSNILVTQDGTPKLLDFGIAKLLHPDWSLDTNEATSTMFRVMTPEYASPEQLRGLPITTASDVYSLGVVLYELLTGERPFKVESHPPEDVARFVLTEEPIKPSSVLSSKSKDRKSKSEADTLADDGRQTTNDVRRPKSEIQSPKSLRGDLDNIILKALRKEPERRYSSVQEFSEDIRRHLEGLPVTASPDTLGYRVRKFTQRHKAVVIAAAIVVITLLTATVITAWQARVARKERDRAENRFKQVRKLANTVLFEYHDGIAKLPGSTPIREKMVKDALEYLDNLSAESSGDPTLQAELATAYEKVGDVQGNPYGANLGNQDGALVSYRKALTIREALFTANRADAKIKLDLGKSYKYVADILWAKGQNDEALVMYRKALAMFEELENADHNNPKYLLRINTTLTGIANVQTQIGDFKSALDTNRKALAYAEAMKAGDATDKNNLRSVAIANLKVGDALMKVTDYANALLHYEKGVQGFSEVAVSAQDDAAVARELGLGYARMAIAYRRLEQYEKAAESNLKAIVQQKQVASADANNVRSHFDIAATYGNLSDNYLQMKKLDNAATSVREAIRIFRETLARNPDYSQGQGHLGATYMTFAEVLLAKGDANGALENYRQALTILEREPIRSAQMRDLANAYEGFGKGYAALASGNKTAAQKRLAHWREARSWFQKSQEIYKTFSGAGKLTGEVAAGLNVVAEEIATCDAAIALLTGK